jgi:uncharacterized protein (DUF1778 family)
MRPEVKALLVQAARLLQVKLTEFMIKNAVEQKATKATKTY